MASLYVRSTDGDNADNGSTWALAKATLAGADAIDAAGDTIYVSQAHAESTAAAVTLAFAGTNANPTKIICGSDAVEPPTAASTAATLTTTGASNLKVDGALYMRGVVLQCGNGYSFASINLNVGNGLTNAQTYESCDLILADTHPSSSFIIGNTNGGSSSRTKLLNCRLKLAATANVIGLNGYVHINGGSFLTGTAIPSAQLFSSGGSSKDGFILIENFDFTNLGSGIVLFSAPIAGRQSDIVVRNCKFASGWTLDTAHVLNGTFSSPAWRIALYNCGAGDTNYRMYVQEYAGITTDETTLVKTGGATDGTTPISWKMASNANCNEAVSQMASPEIMVWNDTSGASKTVTVDVLHDSATNLTDAEIWLVVQELGTSASTLGVRQSDQRADPLATAADQTASSATWTTTGMTNPNKQKLAVTFTPQKKGPFICRVVLGKASKTVYVDPVAQVS
jgi:hypothetical protein